MGNYRWRTVTVSALVFLFSFLVLGPGVVRAKDPCPPAGDDQDQYVLTDEYSLEAESKSGFAGDVVSVTFTLRSRIANPGQIHLSMAICHDPEAAELIGNPSYTEEFQSMALGAIRFEEDPGRGVIINLDLNGYYNARFPSDVPFTLMTIEYRLKGKNGHTGLVTFCDSVLTRRNASCNLNEFVAAEYGQKGSPPPPARHYLSTANQPGTFTVQEKPQPPSTQPPSPQSSSETCPPVDDDTAKHIRTDEYSFEAESVSGAVGDVVGVRMIMNSRIVDLGHIFMSLSVCHDPEVAELVGNPSYTDEFLSLIGEFGVHFYPVKEGAGLPGNHLGHGFLMINDFDHDAGIARFPSDVPITMMTIYYRLKGKPGDTGLVTFCDCVLARAYARSNYNFLGYMISRSGYYHNNYYQSTAHRPGTLTVLEGPTTHPDRPPEPPEAKIYPELPTDAQVNFKVEISAAAAIPGAKEVPVEVYVSADVEYFAIQIPVDFDERSLRLARAEAHFLTGLVLIDNLDAHPGAGPDEGHAVISTGLGVNSRRIAAEGERVHAATLYFDVLENAPIDSTTLSVVPVTSSRGFLYEPWIGVWCQKQTGMTVETVQTEFGPVRTTEGRIDMLPEAPLFVRADSNADMAVDLSDAVFTFSFLFLRGQPPLCPEAADANDDGAIDITDPVVTVATLFLGAGGIPAPYPDPGPYLTVGGLGCY